jgi:hypothetical protein
MYRPLFLDVDGTVYRISAHILQHLQEDVQWKHEKWCAEDWFCKHDNVPAYASLSV